MALTQTSSSYKPCESFFSNWKKKVDVSAYIIGTSINGYALVQKCSASARSARRLSNTVVSRRSPLFPVYLYHLILGQSSKELFETQVINLSNVLELRFHPKRPIKTTASNIPNIRKKRKYVDEAACVQSLCEKPAIQNRQLWEHSTKVQAPRK